MKIEKTSLEFHDTILLVPKIHVGGSELSWQAMSIHCFSNILHEEHGFLLVQGAKKQRLAPFQSSLDHLFQLSLAC